MSNVSERFESDFARVFGEDLPASAQIGVCEGLCGGRLDHHLVDGLCPACRDNPAVRTITRRPTMQLTVETASGRYVHLLQPQAASIDRVDIAHALSRIGRYNGHTRGEHVYSVAQHSVWVAMYVQRRFKAAPELVLQALLHDAHEAYTGDIVSPLKRMPWMGELFQDLQDNLQRAIHEALDVPAATRTGTAIIARADAAALAIEARHLMPSTGDGWGLDPIADDWLATWLDPLPASEAFGLYWLAYEYARRNLSLEELWDTAR